MIVGATFTGADVAEFIHAARSRSSARCRSSACGTPCPAFPTRSELWLRLLEQAGNVYGALLDARRDRGARLVARLRAGDEAAFAELVGRYDRRCCAVARTYVRTDAVAEEVVQETWLAVLRGIDALRGALVVEDVAASGSSPTAR